MKVAVPFGVVSNRIRVTSYRFQLEMQHFLIRISRGIPAEIEMHVLLV